MKKLIFLGLVLMSLVLAGCRNNQIKQDDILIFELSGEQVVELELNEDYVESGFIAKSSISEEDFTSSVVVNTKLDTSEVGTYQISYVLEVEDFREELIRTVIVLGYKENELSLDLVGSKTTKVNYKSTFVDPFVVATDERIGKDISHLVEVIGLEDIDTSVEGAIYTITYELDYNGVFLSEFRTVEIGEDTGISFSINRDSTALNSYSVGDEYIEYGVEITDNILGDIIVEYEIENNFVYENDMIQAGSYVVEYSVEVRGETHFARRIVTFVEQGIEIEVNQNNTGNNTYSVGEKYVEFGLTIIDNATGDFIENYEVSDNFVYENSKIKEGTYTVEYKVSFRGVDYFENRLVVFEDAGVNIEINEEVKNIYFIGEDYTEYGVVFRDEITGEIYSNYDSFNNFEYENGVIKKGTYLIEYRIVIRGKDYVANRTVTYEEAGLDIEINDDNKNSYYVGEDYMEFGVSYVDKVTGEIYFNYNTFDNFQYENGKIVEGIYVVEYKIIIRGVEYVAHRNVNFKDLGIESVLNDPDNRDYYVGENYHEYGVVFRDLTTGEIYTNYEVENNFNYNDKDEYVLEGTYQVIYSIVVRGNIYEEVRAVKYSHILEYQIEYQGYQNDNHSWDFILDEDMKDKGVSLVMLSYWYVLPNSNGLNGEVKFITSPSNFHMLETKSDELVFHSLTYSYNNVFIDLEVL